MPKTAPLKMKQYRAKLRASGLRPVQIWVPDLRSPKFREEARRQSLRVRRRKSEREAADFIEVAVLADIDQ